LTVLAIAGCGGEDSEPTTLSPAALEERKAAELAKLPEPPPKGASIVLKEIYRQFQPPKPNPAVKGSAKAIKMGEASCKGKTPLEVREEFIADSELTDDQEESVSELEKFEKNPSAGFPAGQVAALVYQMSLPGEILPSYGFQGCAYQLSLRLKRELAPEKGK
jgi:hypothetical protein